MDKEKMFEAVLSANANYKESVERNDSAEMQAWFLQQCAFGMSRIKNSGLLMEYGVYVNEQQVKQELAGK